MYKRFTGTGVGEVHAELAERHAQGLDGSCASLRAAVRSPPGVKEELHAQLEHTADCSRFKTSGKRLRALLLAFLNRHPTTLRSKMATLVSQM